jgi:hypothetical protein
MPYSKSNYIPTTWLPTSAKPSYIPTTWITTWMQPMFSKPPPTLHRHPQLNINPITPPKSTHSPPHPPPHHYHSGQQHLPGVYPHHNITPPTTTIQIRVSTSHTCLLPITQPPIHQSPMLPTIHTNKWSPMLPTIHTNKTMTILSHYLSTAAQHQFDLRTSPILCHVPIFVIATHFLS